MFQSLAPHIPSSRWRIWGGAGAVWGFGGGSTLMFVHVPRTMRRHHGRNRIRTASTTRGCSARSRATTDSPSGLPALRVECAPAKDPGAGSQAVRCGRIEQVVDHDGSVTCE